MTNQDRQLFLKTLGEACEKTAWQVHAYCLMRNHFHLVGETPRANQSKGGQAESFLWSQRYILFLPS